MDDDDEAVESHIKELRKEVKKNRMDNDKIVRLLSLSYAKRRDEMMSKSAVTRCFLYYTEVSLFQEA